MTNEQTGELLRRYLLYMESQLMNSKDGAGKEILFIVLSIDSVKDKYDIQPYLKWANRLNYSYLQPQIIYNVDYTKNEDTLHEIRYSIASALLKEIPSINIKDQ
jgi:hypothetical protein